MHQLDRATVQRPPCLDNYDGNVHSWDDLQPQDKRALRLALQRMQGGQIAADNTNDAADVVSGYLNDEEHCFSEDSEAVACCRKKPVSPQVSILSTLAARAYNNEADLIGTMLTLVRDMPKHIEIREVNGKHVSWVPNPINANENFADRWQDPKYPSREIKFRGWLQKVDEDLTTALKGGGIQKVIDILGSSLGRSTLIKAASAIGVTAYQQSQSSSRSMTKGTGTLIAGVGTSAAITPVRRHTFYGDVEPHKND